MVRQSHRTHGRSDVQSRERLAYAGYLHPETGFVHDCNSISVGYYTSERYEYRMNVATFMRESATGPFLLRWERNGSAHRDYVLRGAEGNAFLRFPSALSS